MRTSALFVTKHRKQCPGPSDLHRSTSVTMACLKSRHAHAHTCRHPNTMGELAHFGANFVTRERAFLESYVRPPTLSNHHAYFQVCICSRTRKYTSMYKLEFTHVCTHTDARTRTRRGLQTQAEAFQRTCERM